MKKQISIEALNENMFMTIEMLLNNNDPEASENEKLKPEIAKQVIEAGKVIVSAYKIKADVICALATSGYSKRGKHVVSKDITLQQVTVQHEHLATADVWATTLLAAPAESRTTLLSNYHLNAVLIFEDRKEVYQNGEKKDVQKI